MKSAIVGFLFSFLMAGAAWAAPLNEAAIKAEYKAQAARAAEAVYNVNWGSKISESFTVRYDVVFEYFIVDKDYTGGEYKVRVMRKDESGQWVDRGIDFDVYINDGVVVTVSVDCVTCT